MSSENLYTVGVDLGQKRDYTAIAVLETQVFASEMMLAQYPWPDVHSGWNSPAQIPDAALTRIVDENWGPWPGKPPLHLRWLERTRNEPYPAIVEKVQRLISQPPFSTRGVTLVVDATGVGAAVVDLFRQAGLKPIEVLIHGGDTVVDQRPSWRVPKRNLVAAVQATLQTNRLVISPDIPLADTLKKELADFKVKIDPKTAHDSYSSWREAAHDDLVLALALGVWFRDFWFQRWDRARMQLTEESARIAEIRRKQREHDRVAQSRAADRRPARWG